MRCSRTSHISTHENVYVPLRMHFIYLFRYRSQNCENPFNWSTYKFVDSFQLRMARAHTHTPAHRTKTTAQLHTAKMIIMHLLRCSWNTQIFVDICYKGPVHCVLSAILTKQNEQTKERKKKNTRFSVRDRSYEPRFAKKKTWWRVSSCAFCTQYAFDRINKSE